MNDRDDKQAADVMERAIQALRDRHVPPGPPPTLAASTVEALLALDSLPEIDRRTSRRERMFRIGRYGGITAAIILIAFGGWFLFSGPGTNVSLAQVIEKVREAKSFSYEVVNEPLGNTQSPGWEKSRMKVFFREPGLLREERAGGDVMIQNITAGRTLQYDPSTKKAMSYPFKPQDSWLSFRKFFLDENRKWGVGTEQRLGEREIDGKKAQGFALRENENKVWNTWVDAKTAELLRLELVSPDWKTRYDKIVLNPDLPDTLFSVESPKGYELSVWEDNASDGRETKAEQRRARESEKEAADKTLPRRVPRQ